MASYHYDESGNMALYFIITFLVIILVPFSISALTSATKRKLIPLDSYSVVSEWSKNERRH